MVYNVHSHCPLLCVKKIWKNYFFGTPYYGGQFLCPENWKRWRLGWEYVGQTSSEITEKVIFKLDVKENNMLLNSSKTCMILPHTVQHGNFSPAWNLAILQVGPQSGMIMQQEQISSGNLPDKQWHLHQISSGNLPDKQWHLQPPP